MGASGTNGRMNMENEGQERLSLLGGLRDGQNEARLLRAMHTLLYAAMGLVLSTAQLLGRPAPFGVALVACAGSGITGISALIGASVGYLAGSGLTSGIRYIAAAVLAFTTAFLMRGRMLARKGFFMPMVSAVVMLFTGALMGLTEERASGDLIASVILEGSLAFGSCYFFRRALSEQRRVTETEELQCAVARMLTLSCILLSASRWSVGEMISVGRVAALLLVMAAARRGGMLTGAAVGTVLGLAMDFGTAGSPFYAMAYAFAGLLSGIFHRFSRVVFLLVFVFAPALSALAMPVPSEHVNALFENLCASVIFFVLPDSVVAWFGALFVSLERGSGESGLRRYTAERAKHLGDAYEKLCSVVDRTMQPGENDENIAKVFDRAADRVCTFCKEKNRCWNSSYMDTLSALNSATQVMMQQGKLTAEDLPDFFRRRCLNAGAFVEAINSELRALIYRREMRKNFREQQQAMLGQYRETSVLFHGFSEELCSRNGAEPLMERRLLNYLRSVKLDADCAVFRDARGRLHVQIESENLAALREDADYVERISEVVGLRLSPPQETEEGSVRMTMLECEPLAVSIGIAAMKKQGESISGDKGSYFKTDAGILYVLLSDGMGTGSEAAEESGEVVELLEEFLRCGVEPAAAMQMLNSMLLLRDANHWGCATVDLVCIDLFSGETCFYKYGAAPSYVRTGKSIRRIESECPAAGLSEDGAAPDVVRMQLKPGCTALIASDGVLTGDRDEWLRELLLEESADMKSLARNAVTQAQQKYGAQDDMTVLAVRVEYRV